MRYINRSWRLLGVSLAAAACLVATGCATKKYVRSEIATSEAAMGDRVGGVETDLEDVQHQLSEHEEQLASLSGTARDALERAVAAGKLAEGKFLFETVLTDDQVKFDFDKAELPDAAKAALDEFAERVKSENKNVYIEIQGHTDSTGGEEYNMTLGERRAEAVRLYLSKQHGIALHRMSVISYGESSPIADNDTREGRAQNRRVSLVVLQ